jgi:hypothetical protein
MTQAPQPGAEPGRGVGGAGMGADAEAWRAIPDDLVPVLHQLLSGVTDTVGCHRLNMSARTFSRRVADLLDLMDVQTRFQLGFELARQSRVRATVRPGAPRAAMAGPIDTVSGRRELPPR